MPKFRALTLALPALSLALLAADSPPIPQSIPVAPGWAKSSINTVKFRHSPLATFHDTQFIAYYDANQKVVVGKRQLGQNAWTLKTTDLTGNTADAHNTISIAVDGNGLLHLAWNHHGDVLHYVRGKEPLSLDLVPSGTDGIQEKAVTYPEFYNMPGGDLLLLYRVGRSGSGDLVLKRYSAQDKKWTTIHDVLIAGEGQANAYWEMCVDAQGAIHLGWVWRATPDVASNHDICYAKSTDGGKTWTTAAGKPQALPITAENNEVALKVPQKHDLINQTSIAADSAGNAYICTFFKPADNPITQLMVIYFDGTQWKTAQVGQRKTPLNLAGGGTKRLLLSRPLILVDDTQKQPKINIVFRDVDRGDKISIASTTDIQKGSWTITDLTSDAYGFWEPTCDESLWRRDKIIDLFVQKTDQLDGQDNAIRPNGPDPTMVQVLQVKP